MKYLLDTCVISELVKKRPSARVTRWLDRQDEFSIYLSVITLGELQKGIDKLPKSRKRRQLKNWATSDLIHRFTGRILNIDSNIAQKWGTLSAEAETGGRPVPVLDGLLAATALSHGLTFVTRNTSHIEHTGVSMLNPWE